MTNDTSHQDFERAAAGDQAVLERLLLRYYRPLVRHIAIRIPLAMKAVVQAEDVMQETLVHVYREIDRFQYRGVNAFQAWLKTIAENQLNNVIAAQRRQKRGRGRRRVRVDAAKNDSNVVELVELLAGDPETGSGRMAHQEAVQAIRIGVAGLPDDQQWAIQVRYLDGHSLEETCRIMRRSPGAVRGLLQRAKRKLKGTLGNSSRWFAER